MLVLFMKEDLKFEVKIKSPLRPPAAEDQNPRLRGKKKREPLRLNERRHNLQDRECKTLIYPVNSIFFIFALIFQYFFIVDILCI